MCEDIAFMRELRSREKVGLKRDTEAGKRMGPSVRVRFSLEDTHKCWFSFRFPLKHQQKGHPQKEHTHTQTHTQALRILGNVPQGSREDGKAQWQPCFGTLPPDNFSWLPLIRRGFACTSCTAATPQTRCCTAWCKLMSWPDPEYSRDRALVVRVHRKPCFSGQQQVLKIPSDLCGQASPRFSRKRVPAKTCTDQEWPHLSTSMEKGQARGRSHEPRPEPGGRSECCFPPNLWCRGQAGGGQVEVATDLSRGSAGPFAGQGGPAMTEMAC